MWKVGFLVGKGWPALRSCYRCTSRGRSNAWVLSILSSRMVRNFFICHFLQSPDLLVKVYSRWWRLLPLLWYAYPSKRVVYSWERVGKAVFFVCARRCCDSPKSHVLLAKVALKAQLSSLPPFALNECWREETARADSWRLESEAVKRETGAPHFALTGVIRNELPNQSFEQEDARNF